MISPKISIYSILHFAVDFCCAFFMFRLSFYVKDFYSCFLFYNFCAFALQMPIGLLADKWNRNSIVAVCGCMLTGIVAFLELFFISRYGINSSYITAVILVGIGNGLFHVGGGIEALNEGKVRLSPLGVFVSPGAVGIYLGTILGKSNELWYGIPFLILILGGGFMLWWSERSYGGFCSENVPLTVKWRYNKTVMLTALLCFFVVVVLRSHLGMIFTFPWKKMQAGAVLGLFAVVLGKTAGGILADKIGLKKAIIVSMLLATGCFCFAGNIFFGVAGLFFFNMSMPMTLYLAAEILNRCRGFAFGLLTFAIFIGFLPAYFGYRQCTEALLVIYSLLSFCLLFGGWWLMDKRKQTKERRKDEK